MKFSGERYVPELVSANISYEHWHRYSFASQFVQSKVVLDIACGEGYGAYALSRSAKKVVGVDISAEAIHHASSKYIKENLEFRQGSVSNIPVSGEQVFDVIVSFETIEHVSAEEQEEFLGEVKRLLKPGGIFLVSTPNKLLYSDIPDYQNEYHRKEFYLDEFAGFLQARFQNVSLLGENNYPVSYIWPLHAAPSSLVEHRIKLGQSGFDPTDEAKQALYLLAVCSDAELTEIGVSLQVDLSNQMAAERDRKIQELEYQLTEMELLHARVSDRERSIARLTDQIEDLQKKIADLTQQLQCENQEREEIDRTLHLIYGSTAWKLMTRLWKIRLFLAPHGSRREVFGHWVSEVLQGIRKPFDFIRRPAAGSLADGPQPGTDEMEVDAETRDNASPKIVEAYGQLLAAALNTSSDADVPLATEDYPVDQSPVKLIAFYLPQFHPIPENDAWWGTGFTEWRNVSKAIPQFEGHYQPHQPGELGFYDLRIPEVQERQVALAKKYGISGFCFYYYWFNGKRLLGKPLDLFVENPNIDFPFCLCWANENWTRRWDGQESEILIAQNHSEESDMAFIRDVLPYLQHHNYLRIDGRPVLIVYRVSILPNPQATVKRWKAYCKSQGVPEPYLVAVQAFGFTGYQEAGFDAAVEFPPNNFNLDAIPALTPDLELLNPNYQGVVYNYADIVNHAIANRSPDVFPAVFPAWDNEPRKPGRGSTFAFSTPELYQQWLADACAFAVRKPAPDERLVFINAWNEWAEGAHLEPDRKFGYAYLQATANALASLQQKPSPAFNRWKILFVSHDANPGGAQSVILDIIAWFRQHTAIDIKVVCLGGGQWLNRFSSLAETLVLEPENVTTQRYTSDSLNRLLEFCDGKPDLIYGNSIASGSIYRLLRELNVPIITHVHELENSIQRYGGHWIGDIFQLSQHFIACSHPVRDNLIQSHGVSPDNITTIYASIQSDPTVPAEGFAESDKRAVRQKLGLGAEEVVILGCGLSMPFRKGADLFIDVAQNLLDRGCRNFHFYWVGDFPESEADPDNRPWGDYLRQMRAREVSHYITFLGFKQNVKECLQAADIFALTSREDPFPLVALEAADFALPIVCFEGTGGIPLFVGETAGFVIPHLSVEEMASSILRLMEDGDLRRQKGAAARKKFLQNYTIDRTTPRILSVCRQMARQKPSVSIIVPNYNHELYLPRRLESILDQTFKDFELILLDDASVDGSVEILKEYAQHADVRLICNERNTGSPCAQWIKGIDLAQADIVWIAESDDVSDRSFLETLLPAFNQPAVAIAYANSFVIDEHDTVLGDYLDTPYLTALSKTKWRSDYCLPAEDEINQALGIKNTILNISSALIRKTEVPEQTRKVLTEMRIAGDWYFIVNQIKGGQVCYKADRLNFHRRHSESVIAKTLSDKKVQAFFRETATVHGFIVKHYCLTEEFVEKWKAYLQNQWSAFQPDRSFDELTSVYPFEDLMQAIMGNCTKSLDGAGAAESHSSL